MNLEKTASEMGVTPCESALIRAIIRERTDVAPDKAVESIRVSCRTSVITGREHLVGNAEKLAAHWVRRRITTAMRAHGLEITQKHIRILTEGLDNGEAYQWCRQAAHLALSESGGIDKILERTRKAGERLEGDPLSLAIGRWETVATMSEEQWRTLAKLPPWVQRVTLRSLNIATVNSDTDTLLKRTVQAGARKKISVVGEIPNGNALLETLRSWRYENTEPPLGTVWALAMQNKTIHGDIAWASAMECEQDDPQTAVTERGLARKAERTTTNYPHHLEGRINALALRRAGQMAGQAMKSTTYRGNIEKAADIALRTFEQHWRTDPRLARRCVSPKPYLVAVPEDMASYYGVAAVWMLPFSRAQHFLASACPRKGIVEHDGAFLGVVSPSWALIEGLHQARNKSEEAGQGMKNAVRAIETQWRESCAVEINPNWG